MNLIKIEYRDNQDWIDLNGKVTIWENYSNKFKEDRVQPLFLAPEVITDSWNGKTHDVQHVRYNGFYTEFYIDESELNDIARLTSTKDIRITDYTNGFGSPVIYLIDTTKQENLIFAEPERIADTASWKISLSFRTDRTVINKAASILETNNLNIGIGDQWRLNYSTTQAVSLSGCTIMSSNRMAVRASSYLYAFKKVGKSWVQEGASLFSFFIKDSRIVALSDTRIAVITYPIARVVAFTFTNGVWEQTGNQSAFIGTVTINAAIAKLTNSRVVVAVNGSGDIEAFDFDGTNWASVGTPLAVPGMFYPALTGLTTTDFAFIDGNIGDLRSYNFNGSVFTQVSSTPVTVSSDVYITALSDTSIAYNDATDETLKKYTLGAGWVADGGNLLLDRFRSLAAISENEIVGIGGNDINVYAYSSIDYYSDFEVTPFEKDVNDLDQDWEDGTERTLQRIFKPGLEFLHYLNSSDKSTFIELLKQADVLSINGTPITEIEYEQNIIAEDFYKIIVKGIISTSISNFEQSSLTTVLTHNLRVVDTLAATHNYYTNFPVKFISEPPKVSKSENQTGVETPTKNISRVVKQVKFILNESDAFDLKKTFELWGTVTLDGVPVIENREDITPNLIGVNKYEIIINCLLESPISW